MSTSDEPERLDVAAIREAAEKATPGPWEVFAMDSGHSKYQHSCAVITEDVGDSICEFDALGRLGNERHGKDDGLADAHYIATMDPPTTLALLDALDAARAEVAEMHRVVRGLADAWIRDLGHDEHAKQLISALSTAKEATT